MLHTETLNNLVSRVWDTTAGTVTDFDPPGSTPGVTRPMTPEEVAEFAALEAADGAAGNQRTIEDRLRTHLTRNAEFLALTAPTAAQRNTQIERLTRQCSALARLALRDLSDVEGTAV